MREISMTHVFRSRSSYVHFQIAEGQWKRYVPQYVSPAYYTIEGFTFITAQPYGDQQESVITSNQAYDKYLHSMTMVKYNNKAKIKQTT